MPNVTGSFAPTHLEWRLGRQGQEESELVFISLGIVKQELSEKLSKDDNIDTAYRMQTNIRDDLSTTMWSAPVTKVFKLIASS